MPTAGTFLESWNLVRVHGTWSKPDGTAKLPGKYQVIVPGRLTNSTDDAMIPAGIFVEGDLNVATGGVPSLDIFVPATDDPDIEQDDWKLQIIVTFTSSASSAPSREVYSIDVPLANRPVSDGGNGLGVNLRTIALTQQIAPLVALYGVGVSGGLAKLSTDGLAVLDANGDPITGSGSGGGASSWSALSGKPAALASLAPDANAAAVRTAIGAADAGSVATLATAVTGKADASAVTSALAAKADASALSSKADASAVSSGLAAKADSSALTAGLAGKADATATTAALAGKQATIPVVTDLPASPVTNQLYVLITGTA